MGIPGFPSFGNGRCDHQKCNPWKTQNIVGKGLDS